MIIGYAAAAESYFSNCASLVSPTFHQIALPYKFRSLTFSNRIKVKRYGGTDVIPIPKFCESINAGDAHALSLAPLVQELGLLMWIDYIELEDLIQESFEKIINSVLSFRNLTKLNMERCITSSAIMEQLGKLVQFESLNCRWQYGRDEVSNDALSNLRSLHTLINMRKPRNMIDRHLACTISMKNLQILKSSDLKIIEVLLTTDRPVQLKKLHLDCFYYHNDYSLLWNYLARVTSLTHLSLPSLGLSNGPPLTHFPLSRITISPYPCRFLLLVLQISL